MLAAEYFHQKCPVCHAQHNNKPVEALLLSGTGHTDGRIDENVGHIADFGPGIAFFKMVELLVSPLIDETRAINDELSDEMLF